MTKNLKMEEGFKSTTLLLQQTGKQLPSERLVFIDPRVENYQSLVAGVLPNTVVNILDLEQDGIQQISQALAFQREIKSIHIVSHGDPGRLYLGNSVLSDDNLNRYAGQISGWANALSADAQILLYGCSVAQTEQGKAFVRRLGELTSAIVAASNNLTGSAILGGDWELEVMTGSATPTLAFAPSILESYSGVLAGITITESGGSTNVVEGSVTDTYTIVLDSQPTANVTIDLITNSGLITTNLTPVTPLVFTPGNWFTPQTVTVSAIDNNYALGQFQDLVENKATSSDGTYNFSKFVAVNFTDNDTAGINFNQVGGNAAVVEGDTIEYAITLNSQPLANVTVQLTSGDTSQISTDVPSVTFTTANWNQAQTVKVTAIENAVQTGDRTVNLQYAVSSDDFLYKNIAKSVGVTITEDDSVGINFNQVGGNAPVIEGDTIQYEITLNSQPTADLTVNLTSGDTSQISTDVPSVTFTAGNWNVAQIVKVTTKEDAVQTGDRTVSLQYAVSSDDFLYKNIANSVGVTVIEDDTAGIIFTQTDGSTNVSESGVSDSYSIVLNSQPKAEVTVTINSGNQLTTDVNTFTFDASNWNVVQTVKLTAVNDKVAQGTRTVQILNTLTSDDVDYNKIIDTGVTITDDDTAGILISQTDGSTNISEAGITDSYSIVLNSEPTAEVTITINSSDQLTTDVNTFTFNASNWNVAQTVKLTAVNDEVAQGTRTVQLLNTATSADGQYNNKIIATGVTITDNDTAGILITQTDGNTNVSESGATDNYSIVLNSKPTDDVTITINSDNQLTSDLATLTFTTANWNQAQTVTVKAVDDNVAQGDRTVSIGYTVSSQDAKYAELGINPLAVNISDDDIPLAKGDNDDIFTINGNSSQTKLQVTLVGQSSKFVNELGVFIVDAQGKVGGFAPGESGYAEAALKQSKVIFSAIANLPNGYNTNNLTSLLELNAGDNLRFYLIKNSTSDDVRINKQYGDVLFSDSPNAKITDLGGNQFSLGWNDGSSSSTGQFQDLVVNFQSTSSSLVLGTKLQSSSQGEVIDLRSITSQVTAQFVVNREADFNNFVGFYKVADENGGIDTNGDGQADIFAGQAGYTQAAVSGRVSGIDLTVSNQGTATYSGIFQPGAIYAPFLIANGSPDAILDGNSSDDPAVYFTYLGANSDKVDHVRLLGNNIFGFEDLGIGSDRDFNDVIVKVTFA